jgi:hypothetical protein
MFGFPNEIARDNRVPRFTAGVDELLRQLMYVSATLKLASRCRSRFTQCAMSDDSIKREYPNKKAELGASSLTKF